MGRQSATISFAAHWYSSTMHINLFECLQECFRNVSTHNKNILNFDALLAADS